jgi:hypothetical protein
MVNVAETIDKVRMRMKSWGFRPVTEEDLTPGQRLVMVEVDTFVRSNTGMRPPHNPGCTVIELDDEPVALSNSGNGKRVVFYHCTNPRWESQCFVPLDEFVRDTHAPEVSHARETRFFVET